MVDLDRARGTLFGLAVGDAFGATLEFSDPDDYTDFPTLMNGPLTEIIGQGPFCLRPGQTTDDTQMAICLATSLEEKKGFDADDLRSKYQAWVKLTCDAGRLTKQALKIGPYEAWEKSSRQSAGNGSLMRCSPVGVFYAGDLNNVIQYSIKESQVTHFDPRCCFACAAHNAAIAHALTYPGATAESMWDTAYTALGTAWAMLKDPDLTLEADAALRDLKEDLNLAKESDPLLYDFVGAFLGIADDVTTEDMQVLRATRGIAITGTTMGYVRVAFRLAFWELLHAPSFETGLLDVVNRGGDSDTNGAIAGALLGSLYGLQSIPDRWLGPVLGCRPGGHLNDMYHPSRFTQFIDCL